VLRKSLENEPFPVVAPPGTVTAIELLLRTRRCRGNAVECARARTLRRSEVRSCDGHRSARYSGGWRQTRNAGRRNHSEGMASRCGCATHGYHHIASGGPPGTGATIEVALQLVGHAVTPLNVTVLVPCVEPKFVPVIVTEVPAGPEFGGNPVMLGGGGGGGTMAVKIAATVLKAA
jgi:hypothetical protein